MTDFPDTDEHRDHLRDIYVRAGVVEPERVEEIATDGGHVERQPLRELDGATVYYYDHRDSSTPTRSEDVHVEIYDECVRLRSPADTWIPRHLVEKVLL
ncbi:hypothetical protein [Halomicrobium urmianum]|uniref:hypothetical protein n=1 Tax=Halomicrobium urmianum TaxID=1586233 RepID=UPI001CD98184|nr:hypothetical protein [Halomicrobium urmianum]